LRDSLFQNSLKGERKVEQGRLENKKDLQQDTLIHGTAADGTIRCMAAVTTNLVAEAARRHDLWPTVAAALGRTLTGTLLLGSSLKELDRLTVQIISDGPIGGITTEVNSLGEVRGYVRNPEAHAPYNEKGKFDVKAVVGEGMFYVTRESGYDVGLHRDPYRGSVPLVSGEIAEDFAFYLTKSEQIPSAVMLGVHLQPNVPYVTAAGGLMIQMMPGAEEKIISVIEATVSQMPQATIMIRDGARPVDLLRAALGGIELEVLDEKPVSFACSCSYERAISLISSIDLKELESMLHEDKGAVMTCHFCNETYRLDEAELKNIMQEQR
jgi:molecular chaperone Hsp33